MLTPVEHPLYSCITNLRSELEDYINHNDEREVEQQKCCLFRMHLLGHNPHLAEDRKILAENMRYTLEQIYHTYHQSLQEISSYKPNHQDQLDYPALLTAFARIKDCLEAGILRNRELTRERTLAGRGKLAEGLERCERTYNREWRKAKNYLWEKQGLHGFSFEYNEDLKQGTFAQFDHERDHKKGRFTAIMIRGELSSSLNPPQPPVLPDRNPSSSAPPISPAF